MVYGALIRCLLIFMVVVQTTWAQPIVNNPLIRPPKSYPGAAASPSAPDGNGPLPNGSGNKGPLPPAGTSNGGLPIFQEGSGSVNNSDAIPKIPAPLSDAVANLYVSAIVNKMALLRTQQGQVAMGGAGWGGASPSAAGASLPGAAMANNKSQSYMVRDGEIVDSFTGYKVLVRVQSDSVTLYWLDNDTGANSSPGQTKVIFKGSIDANFVAPAVAAPKLEGPDGGLDGAARKSAINPATQTGAAAK